MTIVISERLKSEKSSQEYSTSSFLLVFKNSCPYVITLLVLYVSIRSGPCTKESMCQDM